MKNSKCKSLKKDIKHSSYTKDKKLKTKDKKLHLPNYLEAGNTVLMVLCVRLQVVNVDVGQAREQQLQLLLVEDRDQPGM